MVGDPDRGGAHPEGGRRRRDVEPDHVEARDDLALTVWQVREQPRDPAFGLASRVDQFPP